MPSVHQRQLISNKNLYLDGCSHKLGGRVLERDSLSLCPPFSVKDLSTPCGHDSPSVVAHHFAPCAIAAAQCWNVLCKITNIGASWINEQYTTTGGISHHMEMNLTPHPHTSKTFNLYITVCACTRMCHGILENIMDAVAGTAVQNHPNIGAYWINEQYTTTGGISHHMPCHPAGHGLFRCDSMSRT